MPITLVASLPKSIPSTATEASADAEVQGSDNDFASMLLGQLTQATGDVPGRKLLLTEAAGKDTSGKSALGEDSEPDNALALLAALGAQTTTQAGAVPATGTLPTDSANVASSAVSTNAEAIPTAREERTAQQGNASRAGASSAFKDSLPEAATDAAGKKPATFAVPDKLPPDGSTSSTAQSADTAPSSPIHPSSHTAVATVASSHSPNPGAATPSAITTSVRDPHWNNDFAQKIVWLASNQKHAAELTLNPPNMGSIEVSLRIDNDQATATFVSTSAEVRETIETALPRLREMFAGVGISLGQANVSAESFRQASGQGAESQGASHGNGDNAILAGVPRDITNNARPLTASGRGLVDLFA